MGADLNFANTNSLWGSFFAETLHRAGVRHAVVCPGSRSAPLAHAFAQHPGITATPILDERSAAFFALGLAQRTRFPVALLCTSGTAAANFYPAVIEARESQLPLLVLTADRPPEMRDCSSGQTIDQVKIFGHYPRWQAELGLPDSSHKILAYLRQTLRHACERTLWPVPGPVHLNVPFRDPLAPVPDNSLRQVDQDAVRELLRDFAAIRDHPRPVGPRDWAEVGERLEGSHRPLIVAGPTRPGEREEYTDSILAFAARWQAPVLADVLSPVRHRAEVLELAVDGYERLFARGELPAKAPDLVLRLGALPTSKRLRKWLSELDCLQMVLEEGDRNVDPLHSRCVHVRAAAAEVLSSLEPKMGRSAEWLKAWIEPGKRAGSHLDRSLQEMEELFEGKVPWLLSRHLPAGAAVFISNSMPVRDAEFFWPAGGSAVEAFFNRGANGIDGILSTAMGVAAESRRSFLVTGELAFLHDQNALLSARHLQRPLTVILINNGGGGIFQSLPIAGFDPPFTEFFLTPQQVDFEALCRAHAVAWERVGTWHRFVEAVGEDWARGLRVIELNTDPLRDRETRRRLLAGD